MIADLEKSYNALSDIKAENDILALENSRIKSKIDFLYTIEGAENNNNFLISFKHSVKKVSTNSIDINSSNGGASAYISETKVSLSGAPTADCPSFGPHAEALAVESQAVEERKIFIPRFMNVNSNACMY